jgi:peptidoglycan/LPS O-acetylase OafA/YrhL
MYRAQIDGLRGISIIAVVFYYIFPNHFPGGFIGVDIFFVISGFLITYIILEEKIKYKFSIITFLERRARRIFPALFLVSATFIPIKQILMLLNFLILCTQMIYV